MTKIEKRFSTEKEFHEQFIRDLEERNLHLVDLKGGTFDAITDTLKPITVEFKQLKDFSDKKRYPHTASDDGVEFVAQANELKKIKHSFPIVTVFVRNRNKYYLLAPRHIEKAMRKESRIKFDKIIISRECEDVPFPNPLTYQQLLDEFQNLIKKLQKSKVRR